MKNKIRELRQENNVTQATLAKHIGVAQNTLSYWEQGKYDIDTESLQVIADFFHCSVDYILGRETKKPETVNGSGSDSPLSDDDIRVALFGGDGEVTDEMWEEVVNFAQYVKEKRKGQNGKH